MPEHFVALSGGIDSTSLALLEPEATLVFTDTGWEFPELYAHLDHIETVLERPILRLRNQKFPAGIPQYIAHANFFPSFTARWCTKDFKVKVLNAYLQAHLPAELFIGLRADEPDRVGNLTLIKGLKIRYPLRERGLTRADCVRLCAEHDLLPRYPVYMARGGCVGCFYKRKSEVLAMAALCPDILDELQELEESVQDERTTFFHMFPNVGTSIRELRDQGLLFDADEVFMSAADRADMGEACGLFCNR